MAFTMHSHSGQFCPGHAKDELEDIVKHAISVGFTTMGLTEHMPRYSLDELYPEELDDPQASLAALPPRHDAYLAEAHRLREKYSSQIHILVAFEAEFIRPSYAARVLSLASSPSVDYFIGSLHHVAGVPIDYDRATYQRARDACGGPGEEPLYAAYYDEQLDMLRTLRPRVVGHFDLVRLMSEDPGRDLREWPAVWDKVVRNLEEVVKQGGWLECNSAALRKGLDEPYPGRVIAEKYLSLGGKFTMSDDSHGIAQVATNYLRALTYLESLGVTELWTFERVAQPDGSATLLEKSVPISAVRAGLKLE
ncbi:related to histidinol-phosphatase [Cephalotrichum gorgonifer]|uniref:Histidinol-phosphatase n=1 Tax=Cephalotrichum gorgonifer TaxID=2041049 RepID=A0AAE8SYK3_9PEZI|nr:related to histidinol-phosphatase [Cephalotrichum gorgonifer]